MFIYKKIILLIMSVILYCFSVLPAQAETFIVTSREDSGLGTLREAIAASNTTTGVQVITFNVPGSNSITAYTPLNIISPIIIDGGKTQVIGGPTNTSPTVQTLKLDSGSDGSVIKNISVVTSGYGIFVNSSNNTISGCAIGIDWSDNPRGNTSGIYIRYERSDNTIGGTLTSERNVISANQCGIISSTGNKIIGNYIGTNASGTLPNSFQRYGISLSSSNLVKVGGNFNLGEGNLISGNYIGIYLYETLSSECRGNSICGNIIGLNASQTAAIPNSYGIYLTCAANNFIGLPQVGYGNDIAGNSICGIYFTGTNPTPYLNKLQNNLIGINPSGVKIANDKGVWFKNAASNLIGGGQNTNLYERNVISGNNIGIEMNGYGNTISGNYIGTDPTGMGVVGNTIGIQVTGGKGNLIGGSNAILSNLQGNVISGQTSGAGILLSGGIGNSINGNTIGLNVAGDVAIPNAVGISIVQGNTGTCIGSSQTSLRNIISANTDCGINMESTTGHLVQGNYIGVNAAGTGALKNSNAGIRMLDTSSCLLGGTSPGQGNIIVGDTYGIILNGADSQGNTIAGNTLGLLPGDFPASDTFTCAISISSSAQDNWIGVQNGPGNIVSNSTDGIRLAGLDTDRNAFFNNTITAISNEGIWLANDGANENKAAPLITFSDIYAINGTAQPGNYIELFLADEGAGNHGGAIYALGSAMADGIGVWSFVPSGLYPGQYVSAIATDNNNNSSSFCLNARINGNTPTITPTSTLTPVCSPTTTPTLTPTPTITPRMHIDGFEGRIIEKRYFYCYPNPAKSTLVRFKFFLQQGAKVKITIYASNGSFVWSQEDHYHEDWNEWVWNASGMANGVYFYKVDASVGGVHETLTKKLALVR